MAPRSLTAGLALLVAAVALLADPNSKGQADNDEPQVVCLTEWGPQATGWYRSRPRECDLHERGKTPVAHVNVWVTKQLRWLRWGPRSAVAKGKLGVSTVGLVPLKVRLTRPRELCGHTVFTRAHLDVRLTYDGKTRRSSHWIWLDTCLR